MRENKKRHTLEMTSNKSKYSNCKIYHPNGKLMCVNSEKKGRWYVEKTGAKILEKNEDGSLKAIQLTFEPKGHGFEEDDVFGLSIQETRCVVTGSTDTSLLTKHHIVPICYRRHLPLEYKSRNHHDVVFITEDKHDDYERIAEAFRDELARKYNVPTEKEAMKIFNDNMRKSVADISRIKGYIIALKGNSLPADRLIEMKSEVLSYISKEYSYNQLKLTDFWSDKLLEDIDNQIKLNEQKYKLDPYKMLVDAVNDYDSFVKIWRRHFVNTMQPKFLPKGWSVDRKTKVQI